MLIMFGFRPLPWEYAVRNLLRRPARTALTLAALVIVVLLVLVVVGFIRGLESSLAVSGHERVVLVHSLGSTENLEYSSVPASTGDLLAASLEGIDARYGVKYVSPELYLGTQATARDHKAPAMALVRGVTLPALNVRPAVQLTEGAWPQAGEVLVGRLAASKLGWPADAVALGRSVDFEGRRWKVSGHFTASGAVFESEMWCPLADLQQAMKRQDLSLVALRLSPDGNFGEVDLFCKERKQLEIQAVREQAYYALLKKHYGPVRTMAWLVVLLVAGAGVFAGLNTMYGAVVGRVRELATLQTLGFVRRAITLSLVQEATLLAAAAAMLAAWLALALVNGAAVRFTMGAFALRVDGTALLIGCGVGLLLGVVGALPAALRAMQLPIVEGLKAV